MFRKKVQVQPSKTRYLSIHHLDWDLKWTIQFPEAIISRKGLAMTWPEIRPQWVQTEDNAWEYEWRTTPQYIAEQTRLAKNDPKNNPVREHFIIGLALKTRISSAEDGVDLTLTLANESKDTFHDVMSDGGCFAAKNLEFRDHDEVKRSYIMVNGKPESMAKLHRSKKIRTIYRCDLADYEKAWMNVSEWFWGRSNAAIDRPAILGAVSYDGSRAVAIGYECATSAAQNADAHHCLHSRPSFGDIPPGQSVTRKGYIRFGSGFPALSEQLGDTLNKLKTSIKADAGDPQ